MAISRISPLRPSIRLSPVHSRENSRSASPERNPGSLYQKIDPLLSNLSPESTLHALTSTEAVPSNGDFSHNILAQSISQVSPAERALGIRAAIASQNLALWYKEVQSWLWPTHSDAKVGKGFVPPVETLLQDKRAVSSSVRPPITGGDVEYYGSLPADVVEEYEKRIEEIRDGMDNLDVDELKEHVLNAHIPSRSRPSSSTSTVSVPPPLSYVQLSDFTAVVTATILRALPLLSRLNSLLTTWDVRLLVSRQIPGLLRELKATRSSLDSSFRALRTSNPSDGNDTLLSASHLRAEHVSLESAVVAVGRRMDRALDALEGRQDSLPESWIDDLEGIESDFAAWVVEAERYRLRREWLRTKDQPKEPEPIESSGRQPKIPPEDGISHTTGMASLTAAAEEPQELNRPMETIEEESEPHPQLPAASGAEEPEHNLKDPVPSSTERTSILPTTSDSKTSSSSPVPETPVSKLTEETKECFPIQTDLVVAEDVQSPTPPTFLLHHEVDTSGQPSPSQVPLPMSPDVQDKENIPPPGYIQDRPLSSSGPKPAALAEHNQMDDDPFIQRPASSSGVAVKKMSNVPVADDAPIEETGASSSSQKPLNESVNYIREETGKQAQVLDNKLDQPEQIAVQGVAPASLADTLRFMSIKSEFEAQPILPEKPEAQTTDVTLAEDPKDTPSTHELFDTSSRGPRQSDATKPAEPPAEPEIRLASTRSQSVEEKTQSQQPVFSRKPLQSPIKLSKTRPATSKNAQKPRQRRRSIGSVGSLLSDNSSLISSRDAPEPQTGSSGEDPPITPSRQELPRPGLIQSHGDHMLREDRLLRLERAKSSRVAFQQDSSVSLPLERFINDKFGLNMGEEPASELTGFPPPLKASMIAKLPRTTGRSTPAPHVPPRGASRRPVLTRVKSVSDLKDSENVRTNVDLNRKTFGTNTAHRALLHQDQPKSTRLRQRLTAHPSLESLGVKRQELAYVEEDESELKDERSRASSPNKRKPRDQLDEKINSILSTLPGRIHLVDPNNEADTSSSSSSMDHKMRERCFSESPQGAPSRSITPVPSLMLMPAARRRLSHAHKAEDSYVKLYHLHHGGQTAPTKLFVRTVGEDGQRVMVRVGGGWADLGEYLREYVIHHGRRTVSETPRVEVQGLTSRSPPGYSPASGTMLTAGAPSYITSGRATPSRPASVISARPPSSLTVRKRRGSNASDAAILRSVTAGTLNSYFSPPQVAAPGGRRLSVSSSYSLGGAHSPANTALASLAHDSQSTPLGLAGPKPRSRQISMSPEGEAWVEDVLQQTRRSSSHNPPQFALNVVAGSESVIDDDHDYDHDRSHGRRSLPKVSSISDIRSVGSSKRVSLRGLGNRR
ncbi:uncharacterized protein N7482_005225 [Penicillium canariense]|uniref:GAR domain-containing protein n=1 Tax=Penicillium canariense TaxID=189055 RepID=A0A9W9I4J2_9EURO|nr:uncharacterized protein N7482_005225 [Penicillium canariense]KAJ5166444.1 hypothetical protein N7482_005225 [Penicillium canariense]